MSRWRRGRGRKRDGYLGLRISDSSLKIENRGSESHCCSFDLLSQSLHKCRFDVLQMEHKLKYFQGGRIREVRSHRCSTSFQTLYLGQVIRC